ncbi:uncharacterized protein LOC134447049 [Engraulis encrasicolus]|uniref:uncharacterized protein LOC134447049 n=1 Tax=Engraulis encrasicolus TaxID=184585 RepID=UPI002FD694AD
MTTESNPGPRRYDTLCFGGHDIFTAIRENSPGGTLVASLSMTGEPETNEITLELTGDNADWLYLEGKTIKLNATMDQDLDREIYGSVLRAHVSCYVNNTLQSEYSLVVEILNENDNGPVFLWNTTQAQNISELAAVNSVVFALQALDADGDTIVYEIDNSSPDAEHFRIDLPNSGQVLLNKPLDYETQVELRLRVYAMEMSTKEQLTATASLVLYVQDGDDHYPQFLPCTILPLSGAAQHVCANPVYTTNITERDEDIILDFYPGPVNAVDGDKGLNTPLTYSILSGADNGRFLINEATGEIRLTRRVENRLLTPSLRLRIVAAQVDDLKKYSVATAIVRVVAENRFPPQFQRKEYRAFLTESTNTATFVLTYGNEMLVLQAIDQDFPDGMNPKVHYSLATNTELFSVTKEGFLIARGNHPPPPHTHTLEVLATDLESGDVANASVTVTILHRGQPVPHSPLSEDPNHAHGSPGRAVGVLGLCLLLLGAAVCVTVRWLRRRKRRRDPSDRGCVAEGKHPNVSLQWFQLVNHSSPVVMLDEVSLHAEALCNADIMLSPLHGKPGIYTVTEKLSGSSTAQSNTTVPPQPASSAIRSNGKASVKVSDKSLLKTVSFRDEVTIRTREVEEEEQEQEQEANTHPDEFVVVDMDFDPGESTTEEKQKLEKSSLPSDKPSNSNDSITPSELNQNANQEEAINSENNTNSSDIADTKPEGSITEKCPPDLSQPMSDTPTSQMAEHEHQTSEDSKSDQPVGEGASLGGGDAESNVDKLTQSQPDTDPEEQQDVSPTHENSEQVSSKHESIDTPETLTDETHDSKAEQKTTDDPELSQSQTDSKPEESPHVKVDIDNGKEIQLQDLEKASTGIPETSSHAENLEDQLTPSTEVQQTQTSTHTHDDTLTQPDASSAATSQAQESPTSPPTRAKTFTKLPFFTAPTSSPALTSSERKTSSDASRPGSAKAIPGKATIAELKAALANRSSAKAATTSSSPQRASEAGKGGSLKTPTPTRAGLEQKTIGTGRATTTSSEKTVIGSGEAEKEDDEEEGDTKVTNLDDVTDSSSKDGL